MGDLGTPLSPLEHLLHGVERKPNGADSHRGAIPKAVVRLANAAIDPLREHAPVTTPRVALRIPMQHVDQILSGEYPLSDSDSENGIVRKV